MIRLLAHPPSPPPGHLSFTVCMSVAVKLTDEEGGGGCMRGAKPYDREKA